MKALIPSAACFLAVLTVLTSASTGAAQPSLGRIEIGRPFPGDRFPTLEAGRQASVVDFRGKPVVLLVFASW